MPHVILCLIIKDFNVGQIYRSHGVVTAPSPPLLVGVLLLGATQFSSDSMTALHTRTVQPVDGCGFVIAKLFPASNKGAVLVKLLCSQSMWFGPFCFNLSPFIAPQECQDQYICIRAWKAEKRSLDGDSESAACFTAQRGKSLRTLHREVSC